MKVGIIGAMTIEVDALKGQLNNVKVCQRAGVEFYEGVLESVPVVIAQCGVGKVNAALCVQIMCDLFSVTHIVNTGVAGSLDAKLDIGDFVISADAMYHDFDCSSLNVDYPVGQVPGLEVRSFPADDRLVALAYSAAEFVHKGHSGIGRIASGDQFVSDAAKKQAIIDNTGALCTEMEGAAIAHAAWRNHIPFVVIRAISDKADNSAEMDYPTFEAIAAQRCAQVTLHLVKALGLQ